MAVLEVNQVLFRTKAEPESHGLFERVKLLLRLVLGLFQNRGLDLGEASEEVCVVETTHESAIARECYLIDEVQILVLFVIALVSSLLLEVFLLEYRHLKCK